MRPIRAPRKPIWVREYTRWMPNMRLTACPVLSICPIGHEHQRAKNDNYQLWFHDDFSPVLPLPPQGRRVRSRGWEGPVMAIALAVGADNSRRRHHIIFIFAPTAAG